MNLSVNGGGGFLQGILEALEASRKVAEREEAEAARRGSLRSQGPRVGPDRVFRVRVVDAVTGELVAESVDDFLSLGAAEQHPIITQGIDRVIATSEAEPKNVLVQIVWLNTDGTGRPIVFRSERGTIKPAAKPEQQPMGDIVAEILGDIFPGALDGFRQRRAELDAYKATLGGLEGKPSHYDGDGDGQCDVCGMDMDAEGFEDDDSDEIEPEQYPGLPEPELADRQTYAAGEEVTTAAPSVLPGGVTLGQAYELDALIAPADAFLVCNPYSDLPGQIG